MTQRLVARVVEVAAPAKLNLALLVGPRVPTASTRWSR